MTVVAGSRGGPPLCWVPPPARAGGIRRLEIPYGHFERAIKLPAGRLEAVSRGLVDGCLVLRLRKLD